MSVNMPYPVSSLVDILSILEAVGEPIKIKKIIKELHHASAEFSDAKLAHESKFSELEKKELEINKKIQKNLEAKALAEDAKKALEVSTEDFKAKKAEFLALEKESKAIEAKNLKDKNDCEILLSKGLEDLNLKTNELNKAQGECDLLIQEYNDKLAKLKAVME
jgi:hypothetical protein